MTSIQTPSQVVDGSPIPMPGIYKEQQALAQKAYATSLANINQRRQAMLQQYGMTGTVDAQGAYSNYRIDPANQYGQLQMMKQNQGLALNDAWNQAAERNLGNSGLAAQGESLLRYSQGGESAQLGQDFVTGMGDLAQENVQNQDTLAQQMYQAEAQARNEAIQNQMFTQANSGSGAGGAGGSGDLNDFLYGNAMSGYDPNDLWSAAVNGAPAGATPMHIMDNGQIKNGMMSIKYKMPDGTTNTISVPAPSTIASRPQSVQQPPPNVVVTPPPINIGTKQTVTPTAASSRAALTEALNRRSRS